MTKGESFIYDELRVWKVLEKSFNYSLSLCLSSTDNGQRNVRANKARREHILGCQTSSSASLFISPCLLFSSRFRVGEKSWKVFSFPSLLRFTFYRFFAHFFSGFQRKEIFITAKRCKIFIQTVLYDSRWDKFLKSLKINVRTFNVQQQVEVFKE